MNPAKSILLKKTEETRDKAQAEKNRLQQSNLLPGSDVSRDISLDPIVEEVYADSTFLPGSTEGLDLLDGGTCHPPADDEEFSAVLAKYWKEMMAEAKNVPIMVVHLAGIYKMAGEYERIKEVIDNLNGQLTGLGVTPALTNERARLRDNMTALTTEGWKLLDAVLGNLSKIQGVLSKEKEKNKSPQDVFSVMESETK